MKSYFRVETDYTAEFSLHPKRFKLEISTEISTQALLDKKN